jgi:capsular polysaccharide biosynthesis protein
MDTETPGSSGPELKEYTALLRRRWRLVGAGVLGGLVLATAGVLAVPSTYSSMAAVQVRPTGMAELTGERSGRVAGDVNLDTEAQIVLSDQVSGRVAETLAEATGTTPGTDDLRERVEVTVPPNSNVLEIRYTADSAENARIGADAYAEAYLARREAEVRELVGSQLDALRAEQETRYESLSELAAESAGATGAAKAGVDARAEALRAEIAELGNGISPLSALQETIVPGQVITPASTPEGPTSPIPALWLLGGAALGLLVGLLAAVARDRLDPRLRDTEETPRLSGVPVLLDLSGDGRSERAVALLGDDEGDGQRVNAAAHLIRTRLAPVGAADPESDEPAPGRIVFTAATTPGPAGTVAAVNLAAALARTGAQTLLVCVDPRTASVNELLGLTDGPGLAEALVEGEDPSGLAVRPAATPRLRVLRHGSADLDAPVQGTAMEDLLGLLRAAAEYVVVALPAVSERADAHALAGSADLLLPVVELGRTPRAALTGLIDTADRFGATVPGTLVLPRQPHAEDPTAEPEPAADTTRPAEQSAEAEEPTAEAGATAAAGPAGDAESEEAGKAEESEKTVGTKGAAANADTTKATEPAGDAAAGEPEKAEETTGIEGATGNADTTQVTRGPKTKKTRRNARTAKLTGRAKTARTVEAEENAGTAKPERAAGAKAATRSAVTTEAAEAAGTKGDTEPSATAKAAADAEMTEVAGTAEAAGTKGDTESSATAETAADAEVGETKEAAEAKGRTESSESTETVAADGSAKAVENTEAEEAEEIAEVTGVAESAEITEVTVANESAEVAKAQGDTESAETTETVAADGSATETAETTKAAGAEGNAKAATDAEAEATEIAGAKETTEAAVDTESAESSEAKQGTEGADAEGGERVAVAVGAEGEAGDSEAERR